MAGRGRGRGYGPSMSFDTAALGIGRGDMPTPALQPPPPFPPLEYHPVPLETAGGESGWEYDYLLALKQEFRATMQDSPYYLRPKDKKDIQRYSDKYKSKSQSDQKWQPDWRRFPKELKPTKPKISKRKKNTGAKMKPNLPPASKKRKTLKTGDEGVDVDEKLEELSKTENQDDDEKTEKDKKTKKEEEQKSEEELDDEEEYDEEEMEEGTDYISNYFDNGEEYGISEDEALEEGPVF